MIIIKEYLDFVIFGLLALMSFVSIWLTLERLLHYKSMNLEQFRHKESLKIDLTQHLTTIANIASNAPYVGLLGTVAGIIITFYDMGQAGNIEVKNIMLGLALSLKATAAGIAVALPAVVFYNSLLRKVEVLLGKWQIARDTQDR